MGSSFSDVNASSIRRAGDDGDKSIRALLIDAGVHPDDLAALIRYVPGALTHLCWRNSVLEDMHAGPDSTISDAEMMRASVATTRIFHRALWAGLVTINDGDGPLVSPDSVEPEELWYAFSEAMRDVFRPERMLPHGVPLGDLAGELLSEIEVDAKDHLVTLVTMAYELGAGPVLRWLCAYGLASAKNYWGTPNWPAIVDELFRILDDPSHSHWRPIKQPSATEMAMLRRDGLRDDLLFCPDEIDSETLEFLIHRIGIGFIRIDR